MAYAVEKSKSGTLVFAIHGGLEFEWKNAPIVASAADTSIFLTKIEYSHLEDAIAFCEIVPDPLSEIVYGCFPAVEAPDPSPSKRELHHMLYHSMRALTELIRVASCRCSDTLIVRTILPTQPLHSLFGDKDFDDWLHALRRSIEFASSDYSKVQLQEEHV